MLSRIRDVFGRLRRNEAGNIAILFGASAIPLVLIIGGAIDFTRFNRYKAQLSNAVDAAALSLARHVDNYTGVCPEPDEGDPAVYCAPATTDTREFIATLGIPDDTFAVPVADITADRVWGGFVVSAEGEMDTLFLPVFDATNFGQGIRTMDMEIVAAVQQSSNRVELALVIDNTGSMNCPNVQSGNCNLQYSNPPSNSRIVAAKAAATTLVNTLMRDNLDDPNQIKIALVPFEGMVNVGITSGPANSWAQPPSWIAWNTTSSTSNYSLSTTTGYSVGKYNGVEFEKYNFSNNTPGCTSGTNCKYMGYGYLFRKVNVLWGGCVQMRPSGTTAATNYELTDITPSTSTPNSLFAPYFWPDEPDSSATVGSGGATRNNSAGYSYTNDYLNDRNPYGTAAQAQAALAKYYPNATTKGAWHSSALKTAGARASPYVVGPNRGCPNPIVPLTSGTAAGKQLILDAIDDMVAYYATGTFVPAGFMWGWHVLSPTLPFTQGIAPGNEDYERTVKAIVLLTDGDASVNDDGNHNRSRYSAWGYVAETDPAPATYRLGSSASSSETALDSKTAIACANAKAGGIRVYTISFGDLSTTTKTMLENCATDDENGNPLYYNAPTTTALADIFRRIGEDLTEIHLSM